MKFIANGMIIDGTGRAAYAGTVVVDGEKIIDILPTGTKLPEDGEVIDAAGCIVAPGFIDSHSHSDAYLILEPDAPSKLSQGITTEINGQCGGSIAPRYGDARLSSDWASLLGERLNWHSLSEYRTELEKVGPGINTIQFIGHNTLRASVIGYAGVAATEVTCTAMVKLLEHELDAGGWGLTTGLIYQPGKYSNAAEVTALAAAAAKRNAFYATHMRSEGDKIFEAIDEVLTLVRATGIRAEISHLKTSGRANWNKIDQVIETIGNAVERGELLGSDRYPFCAAGTDLDVVFSDWAGEGGVPAEMKRLNDAATRQRIAKEIDANDRNWDEVMIGGTWHQLTHEFSGMTVSAAAAERNMTPGNFICELLKFDQCRTGAFFFGMSEDNLDKIYAQPWIVPGSDASLRAPWGPLGADHPHPRAYATMPAFYQRLAPKIGREQTIARMTGVPAARFGIRQRGTIARGNFADLVVFKESEFVPRATYSQPHQFTPGVRAVLVNGQCAYRAGEFLRARAGKFLER